MGAQTFLKSVRCLKECSWSFRFSEKVRHVSTAATATLPTRASLLERVRNPDDASWEDFFRLYRPLVLAVARRAGVPEDDVEDVAQQTFIAVKNALPGFRYEPARSSFKQWLRTLTTHRVIDYFRERDGRSGVRAQTIVRERPGTKVIESIPDERRADIEGLWEEEWWRVREKMALERLKAQVKPQQFQVFQFSREGKSASETARALGISAARVYLIKHRLKKVLDRLAGELEDWEE